MKDLIDKEKEKIDKRFFNSSEKIINTEDKNINKNIQEEDNKEKGGDKKVFSNNNLSMNQLQKRIQSILDEFTYENGEYEYHLYWIMDITNTSVIVINNQDDKYYSIDYILDQNNNVSLDMDTLQQVEITYSPSNFSKNNREAFAKESDKGTSDAIKINLSKDSASNTNWSSVNKTKLGNQIFKASNWKELRDDCYIAITNDGENISDWKYPIGEIKDNTLIYNINGVQSAWSFLQKEQNAEYYNTAKSKLEKIYKKLDLDLSTFSKEDNKNMDKKEKKAQLEKMSALVKDQKYKKGDKEVGKYSKVVDCDDSYMYALDKEKNKMSAIPYACKDEKMEADFTKAKMAKLKCEADEENCDDEVMMSLFEAFTTDANTEALANVERSKKESENDKKTIKEHSEKMSALEKELGEIKVSYSALETEKMSLEESNETLTKENEKLAKFEKATKENEKMSKVEYTLQEIQCSIPKEEVEKLRVKVDEFSTLDSWVNYVKAFAYDFNGNKDVNKNFTKIAIPQVIEQKSSTEENDLWGRIKNQIK